MVVMALAPVNVVVCNDVGDAEEIYETQVGKHGQTYDLRFADLMNLIKMRQGSQQKRLEYKK